MMRKLLGRKPGNQWDSSICTDGDTCAKNCALEGVDAGQYASLRLQEAFI